MKKSLITLSALAVLTTGLVAGCSKKPSATSTPVPSVPAQSTPAPSTPAPSTPAPSTPAPTAPTIAELLSTYFEGVKGEFADGNYTYVLKQEYKENKPTVTIEGTYMCGGEWSYYSEKRSGYITDGSGYLFMHTVDAKAANVQDEVNIGAKIRVTGTLTDYHGYPQLNSGWSYELIEAAPTEASGFADIEALYQEVSLSDLMDSSGKLKTEMAAKPVLLRNMVLTSEVTEGDLTYFTPLSEISNEDAQKLPVYRFHMSSPSTYVQGNVFDVYGMVTSYQGKLQLHVTAQSNATKFVAVRRVDASSLTPEQNLVLADLKTNLSAVQSKYTFDYVNEEPSKIQVTLTALVDSTVAVAYKLTYGEGTDETWATAGRDIAGMPSLTIKTREEVGSTSGKVTLVRRVYLKEGVADEAAAWALTDTAKYKDTSKEITIEHIRSLASSLSGEFADNKVPSGWAYQTNNASYPNPSWGSGDFAGSIKLTYNNSGIYSNDPTISLSKEAKLTLNLAIDQYTKSGTTVQEADRKLILTVTGLDADGQEVAKVETQNLYVTGNKAFRDVEITLTSTTADIASVKIIVKTCANSTLYVKVATIEAAGTPEVDPGTGSGSGEVDTPVVAE